VSRTTADSARIAGALTGAALVATMGSGWAYLGVCLVYVASLLLTFGVGVRRVRLFGESAMVPTPLAALKAAFAYVWSTPDVRALMLLAFTMNFAAYPIANSLLAYVAREIYGLDQTGLGWLIASFSGGALLGSILLSTLGAHIQPARTMLSCALTWFALNFAFSWLENANWGRGLLFAAGFVQSFCMVPMAVLLLRTAAPEFRGRVMGVRMLAVYGMPVGLLLSGQMVEYLGYPITGSSFSLVGAAFTLWIAVRWRTHLWRRDAPANT
jgi:Na+/melibiose symporter-like transporter